ncbi:MAG: Tryptophan--tRNA ligase [Pseudomonadota bacterium]
MKKVFKKVFSGVQPTGNLHLGNYLGAITNWLDLQEQYQCLFGIMDLHAITIRQDPKVLKANIVQTLATYLACGLDLQKSKIFLQSQVPAHTQLAWVLATITPLGWLNRMTQFKDKAGSGSGAGSGDGAGYGDGSGSGAGSGDGSGGIADNKDKNSNLGLYSYPVLMASDILLYQTDLVPVGDDQKQHLELTRNLALAFNNHFNCQCFKLPEPLIIKQNKRIMSLQDGTKKMSKSDPSEISRINLTDSADEIVKKIKKAKTDSQALITYDEKRSEIFNLLNIFASFSEKNPQEIADYYANSGYGKFKSDLADLVVAKIEPISKKIKELITDQSFLNQQLNNCLEDGQQYAQNIASKTYDEVIQIVGLKL